MGYVAAGRRSAQTRPRGQTVSRSGDTVTLDLICRADGVMLVVPAQARRRALTIGGVTHRLPAADSIFVQHADCGHARK